MWYFSGQGADASDATGEVSVMLAIKWAIFSHLGSIAMGSFLIAVVTMIRVVFEYIVEKYEQVGNKENPIYKAVKCFIRCMLWCLDQCVKFITKNAYIQIALRNTSFCKAAFDSFMIIMRNFGRFSSAGMIGTIMMMLGKGTIMGCSAALTMIVVKHTYPQVQQPFIPAIVVTIVAYLVASLFLSIFSFSCTAILHSFLYDEDCGGSNRTPKSLQSFTDYEDKKAKEEAEKKE